MLRTASVAALALTVLACSPTSSPSPDAQTPAAVTRREGELRSGFSAFAAPSWGTTASMSEGRFFHTATLMPGGKVLVAGGFTGTTSLTSTALYDPLTGRWTAAGPLATNRYQHTATLLPNGKVLVTGGYGTSGFIRGTELFDPASGTWTSAAPMTYQRIGHTATLLRSGKVLVAGGSNGEHVAPAELYDPVTNSWASAGSLAQGRLFPTATLLPSGKVLLASGSGSGSTSYLTTSELYDPATNSWSATGSLAQGRYQHTATLLPDGKVLLAGGKTSTAVNNADLYDPATGTWTAVSPLSKGREYPTATLLPDGKVLLVGGEGPNTQAATAEVYDPATHTWMAAGALSHSTYGATATLLPGGKVFVVGGYDVTNNTGYTAAHLYEPGAAAWTGTGALNQARYSPTATLLPGGKVLAVGGYDGASLGTAELYDPATSSWTPTSPPNRPRYLHSATLLLNGKVLVAGGSEGGFISTAELYDPATGAWTPTGSLAQGRDRHTATLLPNGKVLVAGGYGVDGLRLQAELYDPATGTWRAAGSLQEGRDSHAATLLPDGKVLIAGGYGSHPLASAELYDPATDTWSTTGPLPQGRSALSLTLLPEGKVLAVGGFNNGALASTELYDPATGTWSAAATLTLGRDHHSATLLPSGQVLVAGGYNNGPTISTEVYDPATSSWTVTAPLLQERDHHLATLLPSGQVLIAGGFSSSGYISSAELYDVGAPPEWRPSLTSLSPSSSLAPGSVFTVYGTRFRGISEASSGSTWSSASDVPLLTLVDLERGRLFAVPSRDFSSTHVTATVPDVPAGHYLLSVTVNALSSSRMLHVVRDVTAPDTTLTETPASVTRQTDATFRFEANEAASTFTCSLDEAAFSPCTSPAAYANLSAGSHTFQVRARDMAGNVDDSPASFTWTIDVTAPDTTLTETPASPTNQTGATFAFSSEAGATFECSLDGAAFGTCTPPLSYSSLTEGSHTFQVRARDAAGNVDATPASFSWTVDLTAPETNLTATPAPLTTQTGATFTFSSEAGATFECSLDGAAFGTCTSPLSYSSLTEGSHTFQVRARDMAGNVDATPASFTWTVDLTAPETNLTATPAPLTTQTGATFTFSSEAGATFECSLDGAAFGTCTSPLSYSSLTEGSHTFQVRARDAAGNVDATPASFSWMVDLTAPETNLTETPVPLTTQTGATFAFTSEAGATFECSLDGAAFTACSSPVSSANLAEGTHTFQVRARDAVGNLDATPASFSWTIDVTGPDTTLTSTPPDRLNQTHITFTFVSNDAAASFECSLNGATFVPCTSPAFFDNLAPGVHTFRVRAHDAAGNVDATPASASWTIDLTVPDTTLTSAPSSPSNQTSATFSFSTTEDGAIFECALDGSTFDLCSSPLTVRSLVEGPHVLRVRARDAAGNVDATPASHSWEVDLTAPETTLSVTPANPTRQTDATFAFSSEAGATFECSLDGAAFTACTSALTYANLTEGNHTFRVRARDAAGNVDATPASHSWTIDVTAPAAPVITSPTQGATLTDNTPSISGTAQPGSTVIVTLDGMVAASVTADASGTWAFITSSDLADGEHAVSATASDAGGTSPASATVRFTVDTTPDTPDAPGGGCGCAAGPGDASWLLGALALLGGAVSRRRRTLA
jgi:MYXO-CTERM domain-containing protein